MLLSISCKFRHFHQKKRHVTTKHAFQQILCSSAFHVSFTISVKKKPCHNNSFWRPDSFSRPESKVNAFLTLPTSAFPSVHIVGNLTSKLPLIIWRFSCPHAWVKARPNALSGAPHIQRTVLKHVKQSNWL